jgi:gluconolactonase
VPPGTGGAPFVCPAPPFAAAPFPSDVVVERIAGVPPEDSFTEDAQDLVILEGPVWLGDSLYLSEINNGPANGGFPGGGMMALPTMAVPTSTVPASNPAPPARLLKVSAAGVVSVVLEDSGTAGLAISPDGSLVGCNHKTGAITRFDLAGAPAVDLVASYDGVRFNSPNDLAFGADGSLYFTDPDYQAPSPTPQSATRAYRVAPGTTTAEPIVEGRNQPNGVSFAPDYKTLYLSGTDGVVAYPVMVDGTVGAALPFASDTVRSSDGMVVDCAGNLYTTSNQVVTVVNSAGAEVARVSVPGVQSVTNVAFGGEDGLTLYITTLGTGTQVGLFKVVSSIPGMPY